MALTWFCSFQPPLSRRLLLSPLEHVCYDNARYQSVRLLLQKVKHVVTLYSSKASFHEFTKAESSHISECARLLWEAMLCVLCWDHSQCQTGTRSKQDVQTERSQQHQNDVCACLWGQIRQHRSKFLTNIFSSAKHIYFLSILDISRIDHVDIPSPTWAPPPGSTFFT